MQGRGSAGCCTSQPQHFIQHHDGGRLISERMSCVMCVSAGEVSGTPCVNNTYDDKLHFEPLLMYTLDSLYLVAASCGGCRLSCLPSPCLA